jgi:molybdate transport repressor ModE-like protein
MKLVPTVSWALGADSAEALDPRLLPLLEAIARDRTLAAAVGACGISYRAAWGLLRDSEALFGTPLVELERGRGARLTFDGERLLDAQRGTARRLTRTLASLAVEIGPSKERQRGMASPPQPALLRVAASHDLALQALRDQLPAAAELTLDIVVMGSLHALAELDAGHVELAGFHVPSDLPATALAPFRALLRPARDRLIRFVDREQGFIVPKGNPARVRGFADLARKNLRFINRQEGSGTRMLVDRLLSEEGVLPSALAGYRNEELTHRAVAAMVASGAADAGFGLRAAAAEYRLGFVPLAQECYYLAARASALSNAPIARLIEFLHAPEFARITRSLAGYRSKAAGQVIDVSALGDGHDR